MKRKNLTIERTVVLPIPGSKEERLGPASKQYSLAPLTSSDALRTLLNAKPETLAKLKESEKKPRKAATEKD